MTSNNGSRAAKILTALSAALAFACAGGAMPVLVFLPGE